MLDEGMALREFGPIEGVGGKSKKDHFVVPVGVRGGMREYGRAGVGEVEASEWTGMSFARIKNGLGEIDRLRGLPSLTDGQKALLLQLEGQNLRDEATKLIDFANNAGLFFKRVDDQAPGNRIDEKVEDLMKTYLRNEAPNPPISGDPNDPRITEWEKFCEAMADYPDMNEDKYMERYLASVKDPKIARNHAKAFEGLIDARIVEVQNELIIAELEAKAKKVGLNEAEQPVLEDARRQQTLFYVKDAGVPGKFRFAAARYADAMVESGKWIPAVTGPVGVSGLTSMTMDAGVGSMYTPGQKEAYGMLEFVPKNRQEWIDATRAYMLKMIEEGESYQSFPRLIRYYLVQVKREPGDKEIVDALAVEARAVQGANKMADTFKKLATSGEGLKKLGDSFDQVGVSLTPDFFKRFSNWAPMKAPEYLRKVIGGNEEGVSASVVIDRAMWMYVGFMGDWAEKMGKLMDESERAVAPGARKDKLWSINPRAWQERVDKDFKARNEKFLDSQDLVDIETKWLKTLGIATDKKGTIDMRFLRGMFATMPEKLRAQVANNDKYRKVVQGVVSGRNMRLVDVFGRTNVFCEDVTDLDKQWSEWVVAAMSGGEYGQKVALNLVLGSGEASQMNETEATFPVASDALTHMTHMGLRQASEGKIGAPVGSEHVAGRYTSICKSLLRASSVGSNSVYEHLKAGKRFTQLDWENMKGEPGGGWTGVTLLRGVTVNELIAAQGVDLGKELTDDEIEKKIKPLSTASADWLKTDPRFQKVKLDEHGKPVMKDGKVVTEPMAPFERRDAWAKSHLAARNLVMNKAVANVDALSQDEWPPTFTWALGVVMEHCPAGGLLPEELQSPMGIVPARASETKQWTIHRPSVVRTGTREAMKVEIQGPRSLPAFLDMLQLKQILTTNEVYLLAAVLREARTKPALAGMVPGAPINVDWNEPRA